VSTTIVSFFAFSYLSAAENFESLRELATIINLLKYHDFEDIFLKTSIWTQ